MPLIHTQFPGGFNDFSSIVCKRRSVFRKTNTVKTPGTTNTITNKNVSTCLNCKIILYTISCSLCKVGEALSEQHLQRKNYSNLTTFLISFTFIGAALNTVFTGRSLAQLVKFTISIFGLLPTAHCSSSKVTGKQG